MYIGFWVYQGYSEAKRSLLQKGLDKKNWNRGLGFTVAFRVRSLFAKDLDSSMPVPLTNLTLNFSAPKA